ncbi:MAG: GvpL/GvpF family gas vesicle protein [Pikeienuella sp.]
MSLHLHGVVSAADDCPLDAPPHLRLQHDDIGVLATETDEDVGSGPVWDGGLSSQAAALLSRHDLLLAAYARRGPCLPLRIGSAVASADDARHLLALHAGGFRRALSGLSGRAAFTVRAIRKAQAPRSDAACIGGGGYLAARLRARKRAAGRRADEAGVLSELANRLEQIGPVAVLRPVARRAGPAPTFARAVLVPERRVAELKEALDDIRGPAGALGLEITAQGPQAPYAFAPTVIAVGGTDAGEDVR